MEEIKILVEEVIRKEDGSFDLKEYSEGGYKHGWFTLPVTREEILEQIGLDIDKDEYFIKSYEPDNISIPRRYQFVEMFNDLYEKLQALEGTPFGNHIEELQIHFIHDLDRLLENLECIKFYPGYSDYEEFLKDKDIDKGDVDSRYLVVSDGIFEYDY